MDNHQMIHVGMLNSFNVITGKATFDDVLNAGIGYFAHDPNELSPNSLEMMIYYFQEHEMFEYCAELKQIYDENYNPDGTPKEQECECYYPMITEYSRKMRCGDCGKRIIR